MLHDFDLGFLTPINLGAKQLGKQFLSLLQDHMFDFSPERIGNYEPIKLAYNFNEIDACLDFWENPFLWKRRKPRVLGNVWMSYPNQHSSVYITANSKQLDPQKIVEFFKATSHLLQVDFAYLHFLAEPESESWDVQQKLMPFRQGVTTHDLRKNIPNLCWATVFGKPYTRLFLLERILCAPAPIIQEIDKDTIYIQLSQDIFDLKSHYESINLVREKVKRHLNCNAFLDTSLPPQHQYTIPKFTFDESVYI
ncbi:hypothetical protein [Anthocerotibacter panamensis]|uniref:hypothetical protein n=1 Tax=Anthocerotibacter panamensis TaxID=2857077 RepID=UPI001C405E61|nr:hypothetical protein [Anthocerotibacter panamensis]